jgi:sugar/nucleoside kinase (ribokinase family)
MEQSCGGAVPNTAIDLAKLAPDFPVRVFGKVGDDEYGRFAIDMMASAGLDVSKMLITKTAPTSFTDVINVKGGERTFFTLAGANAELDVEDFDFEELGAPHLHAFADAVDPVPSLPVGAADTLQSEAVFLAAEKVEQLAAACAPVVGRADRGREQGRKLRHGNTSGFIRRIKML